MLDGKEKKKETNIIVFFFSALLTCRGTLSVHLITRMVSVCCFSCCFFFLFFFSAALAPLFPYIPLFSLLPLKSKSLSLSISLSLLLGPTSSSLSCRHIHFIIDYLLNLLWKICSCFFICQLHRCSIIINYTFQKKKKKKKKKKKVLCVDTTVPM